MPAKPKKLTVHTYQVGFGDCFLLTFDYGSNKKKNILIDFGSVSLPAGASKTYMRDVALDIQKECGGKLDAIVATHRHKDHISGFAPANGKGPGDIIRACNPDLVLQPWTEDPKAAANSTGPKGLAGATGLAVRSLSLRQKVAEAVVAEIARTPIRLWTPAMRMTFATAAASLSNPAAVKNLQTMAPANKHRYLYYGAKSGLESILPGVQISVLGPPTLKQSTAIKKESQKNKTEFWPILRENLFWQLQAKAMEHAQGATRTLFPRYAVSGNPLYARWVRRRAQDMRQELLFELVRSLDKALNNTSVILLFTIGTKGYLFPGDAQLENWQYALGKASTKTKLKNVVLYKVGHHGSQNATPKSLWSIIRASGKPTKLKTVVSTKAGVYGSKSKGTEVPRGKLVDALKKESVYYTTQDLKKGAKPHDIPVNL